MNCVKLHLVGNISKGIYLDDARTPERQTLFPTFSSAAGPESTGAFYLFSPKITLELMTVVFCAVFWMLFLVCFHSIQQFPEQSGIPGGWADGTHQQLCLRSLRWTSTKVSLPQDHPITHHYHSHSCSCDYFRAWCNRQHWSSCNASISISFCRLC